ncbi:MAG TPA: hypothetical protein VEI99_08545 [Terriglobales bacterium]|nr:hypothetical protein [Terriglobales bacterium]
MNRSFPIDYADDAIAREHDSQLGRSPQWTLIRPFLAIRPAKITRGGILSSAGLL